MLKPKKKFSKKELRQDKFVTATFKTQAFIQENRNTVIGIVAGVLILFSAIIWFISYQKTTKANTGTLVTEGALMMEQGQREAGLNKFKEAVNNNSDESSAYAAFLLGKEYLSSDSIDLAMKYFEKAISYSDQEDLLGPAYMNLASVQQMAGNIAEAEENYNSAVNNAPFPDFKADALYNLGLVQEKLNKAVEAAVTFGVLVSDFPKSELANKAKIHLIEIK